jgi:hypothetical protein
MSKTEAVRDKKLRKLARQLRAPKSDLDRAHNRLIAQEALAELRPDWGKHVVVNRERMRALLEQCQWTTGYCPSCAVFHRKGHKPDCELAYFLTLLTDCTSMRLRNR